MRHLHFTQSLEPVYGGGLGVSAVALHRHWLRTGVQSTVCATYGEARQEPATGTHEFRRIKPDALYFAPELRTKAKEFVRQNDVVHGHGFYVGTNFFFGAEARRQGKPLVYHAHGFFDPWILNRSRWKKWLVHRLFEDGNFEYARLWRALTEKEADQIRGQGIQAPIVVAPGGVDLSRFSAAQDPVGEIQTPIVPRLTKTRRRAVFMARLHPKKGLNLLLPAWKELAGARRDWELIVAGPDEGGYAAEVDRMIAESGLRNSVLRVGQVTHEPKVKLLKSADLFVLPSHSEGFANAILEAMAASVPVVATRACNFPELFAEGGGWDCDANRESLRAAIAAAIAASDEERRERGHAGRRLAERRYTWEEISRRLLDACSAHCR